ncbi:DUF6415 family natural product biosynthesis protein [Streptomyces sp. NPDC057623]|uniref:DUF6415 family natural product biosynthesis protein n=1 Tax=Streptomyces sp. NPDC057623 TaxID=3346187 RepID=UPI00369E8E11
MTMRIYTMDRSGTVIEERGTVSVPDSQGPLPLMSMSPQCACPRCRAGQGGDPMNTTDETDAPAPSMAAMRASASWFIDQTTLLGHQTVKSFEEDLHTTLEQLIPQIEKFVADKPPEDAPAQVALAAVEVARHRMNAPEAAGLRGEMERVGLLAQSVMSLSHHHDALTGHAMWLSCGRIVADEDEWEPYVCGKSSGGAARPGRVHATCAAQRR